MGRNKALKSALARESESPYQDGEMMRSARKRSPPVFQPMRLRCENRAGMTSPTESLIGREYKIRPHLVCETLRDPPLRLNAGFVIFLLLCKNQRSQSL